MAPFHHLVERKGRYQLLARSHESACTGTIAGYAVTTLAGDLIGDLIGEESTLAMARARMDQLVEADIRAGPAPAIPRARAGALRR